MQGYIDSVSTLLLCFCLLRYVVEVGSLVQESYTLRGGTMQLTLVQGYIDSISTLLLCLCLLRYVVEVGTLAQV